MKPQRVVYDASVGEGVVLVSHMKAGSCSRVFHEASCTEVGGSMPSVFTHGLLIQREILAGCGFNISLMNYLIRRYYELITDYI